CRAVGGDGAVADGGTGAAADGPCVAGQTRGAAVRGAGAADAKGVGPGNRATGAGGDGDGLVAAADAAVGRVGLQGQGEGPGRSGGDDGAAIAGRAADAGVTADGPRVTRNAVRRAVVLGAGTADADRVRPGDEAGGVAVGRRRLVGRGVAAIGGGG